MMLPTGRRPQPLKNRNSFTLVELLLVVIILGVFAGLAVPSFRKTYYNQELSNAASNVAFLMRYAQGRAVAERANYRLNFDEENKSCWLEKKSSSGENVFERISSGFARGIIFPAGIKVSPELKPVGFYPDGKIDSVKIYLERKNTAAFTISTQGHIGYVEVLDFRA